MSVSPKTKIDGGIAAKNVDQLRFPVDDWMKYYFQILQTDILLDDFKRFAQENTSAVGNITASTALNLLTSPTSLTQETIDSFSSFNNIRLGSKAEKSYYLPLPRELRESHRVNYNDNYGYLDAVVPSGSPLLEAGRTAAGVVLNTFKSYQLEVPSFNTHNLTWKFSPKSKEESIAIQKILHSLKTAMLPRKFEGMKLILKFPRIFFLAFIPNVQYLFKFKPCVLADIQIDYEGGNQVPTFFKETGAPESIVVSMVFKELEYWLSEDFVKDTDGTGMPTKDYSNVWNFYGNPRGQ